jgi:hypothetical protein
MHLPPHLRTRRTTSLNFNPGRRKPSVLRTNTSPELALNTMPKSTNLDSSRLPLCSVALHVCWPLIVPPISLGRRHRDAQFSGTSKLEGRGFVSNFPRKPTRDQEQLCKRRSAEREECAHYTAESFRFSLPSFSSPDSSCCPPLGSLKRLTSCRQPSRQPWSPWRQWPPSC